MPETSKTIPIAAAVPVTAEDIAAAARLRELPIPAECEAGVATNLALLARHAATMRGKPSS